MKKILISLFAALVLFSSCRKENDDVFDQSPDARLKETLDKYQAELEGAQYGWKALIKPGGSQYGVYSFYFKFKGGNRVDMFSDFDSLSSVKVSESSYRFKALQQPALIFDTYSYLHVLADPDATKNGGVMGKGLSSDFEFSLEGMTKDSVLLKGRVNGTRVSLVKATADEAAAYYEKKHGSRLFNNVGKYITYFKRLTVGGTQYDIIVDIIRHTITFTWKDNSGALKSQTTGFYFTTDGVAFEPAFNDNNTTIKSLTDMTWDPISRQLNFRVNGTNSNISEAISPVSVDNTAAQKWWSASLNYGFYWRSMLGFHDEGVDDAYSLTKTANFNSLVFIPQFNSDAGVIYDLLGGVLQYPDGLGLAYGLASRPPTFTSDGKIIFPFYGVLGNIPTADEAAIRKTFQKMLDPNGFYVIETGPTTVDLVSAKDARAWISFYVWQ